MSSPEGKARRVRAVDEGVPAEAWRRVHPISPALNAWKALAALLAIIVYQNADLVTDVLDSEWAHQRGGLVIAGLVVAALLVFLLVAGLYSWLAWRATSYAVTDNAVWFRSGILFRSQRHARLDRIQSVDVVHPLLGRLFGLGQLSVEVAGGSGSNLTFGFLSTQVLEDLRAEILARAAGLRLGPVQTSPAPSTTPVDEGGPALVDGQDGTGAVATGVAGADGIPAGPGSATVRTAADPTSGAARTAADSTLGATGPADAGATGAGPGPSRYPAGGARATISSAPVAQEHELYRVPVGRLLGSMFLSSGTFTGILVMLAMLVGILWATIQFGPRSLTGLVAFIPAVLGVGSSVWGRFSGEFNFTAAVSADGIRIRRGLTETRSQTVPPRRVHAVQVSQPFLWRRRGWYRVTITQAGRAWESSDSSTGSITSNDVLLPVGTREEAELAVWLVVRDLGVEDPRAFLEAGLHGSGEGHGYVANPRRTRVLDPVSWHRRAVALTRTCLVVREGRVSHTLTVAPVERLQSIEVAQGPWMRHLDVATLHMHIVPGSVHAVAAHVDATHARDLLGELLELAQVRRASEPPEKWMLRVARAVPDAAVREAIVEEAAEVEAGVGAGAGDAAGAGAGAGDAAGAGAGAGAGDGARPVADGAATGDRIGSDTDGTDRGEDAPRGS